MGAIIGYLLIGTDNTARKQVEAERMKLDQRLRDQQFYTRSLIESNIDALMTTDPRGHHHRRQQADGGAHRLHARRADRRAVQELLHRSGAGRGRHQAGADASRRSPTTSSPPAPGTARKRWCPTMPRPSTTATGSCRACSPPRATSPSASVSSRRCRNTNVELESAKARGGKGQPRQVGVPLQHEPRAAHAAQRDPRLRPADGLRFPAADAPPRRRSIEQILQAGWYLLELINEILDLALIESGKLSLSLEPMSLAEVMRECQAMIEPQGAEARHPHDLSPVRPAVFVNADRTRFKQILINLLSNAIKYNRTERQRSVVDCTRRAPERIRICVKDTGEGLAPDKLAQLFQPFNRLGQEAAPRRARASAWW